MKRILVIALGGTIGSVRRGRIGLDKNNLKILDCCKREGVEFVGVSPFSVLSENMSIELWRRLIEFIEKSHLEEYDGTIILHGSDTLAFTSSIIANAFPNESIVLVAANKPVEDEDSNGKDNFNAALDILLSGKKGVFVSYGAVHGADSITSADIKDEFVSIPNIHKPLGSRIIYDKNILIVNSYVGMNFESYNLENTDAVLIGMYHSATVPESAKAFSEKCKSMNIPCYFVTHKLSADYESAAGIDNIIFGCTMENAYARMLLTK